MGRLRTKSIVLIGALIAGLGLGVIALRQAEIAEPTADPNTPIMTTDGAAQPSADANTAGSSAARKESDPDAGNEEADPIAAADEEESGTRVPIPLGAEFLQIMERDEELAKLHEQMEREPRDFTWADRLENFLDANFISSLDIEDYRIEALECRTKTCVMLAIGYGDDATTDWFEAVSDLLEREDELKSMMGGPGNASCGAGTVAPGIYALNCVLTRTDVEPEENNTDVLLSLDAPYPDNIVVEPVDVADAVAAAIETNQDMYDLHRRLEQEATDAGWSSYIEPLISDFLAHSDLAQEANILDVTCRTTLCEIQLVSSCNQEPCAAGMATMLEFHQQDWHDLQIAGIEDGEAGEDGQVGEVWILERRQAP